MTSEVKFTAHSVGTPPAKGASQSAPAVFSPSKEPDNDQLRERLKDDILSKGTCNRQLKTLAGVLYSCWRPFARCASQDRHSACTPSRAIRHERLMQ